jgi:selenocysteine lyase/cysteine desulfurase
VQFSSGFRLDLAAAGKLCKSRGLLLAVNAAQALGQIPVNVRSSQIDFLCGTSHKWMMGGFGVGLFYVRRAVAAKASLPFAGWLSTEDPMRMDGFVGARAPGRARTLPGASFTARGAALRRGATALEAGSGPWAPILGFGAALELIERIGVEQIEAHNARLQSVLRPKLRALGFSPNAPDDPAQGSGICVVKPEGDPLRVVRALADKGVVVSPRGGGLRISTHVFNNQGDLDRLFWALQRLNIRPAAR